MNLLKYLFSQSPGRFLAAAVAGLASGLSGAVLAKLISSAVQGTTPATAAALMDFFGCCAFYFATKTSAELFLMRVVQDTILRQRIELSRCIVATPQARLQSLGKSELLAILTNDIATFVQAFQMLPLALGNAVVVLACCGYLAWLSGPLFVAFGMFLVACLVGYHLAERRPLRHMVGLREQLERLYEHFRGLVDGTRELQLNRERARAFVDDVITPDARRFRGLFLGTMSGYTWVSNAGVVLFYVAIGLLLFVSPRVAPQGPGVVATFALVLLFLVRPLSDMMFALPVLRQADVSLARIRRLEDGLERGAAAPVASPFPRPVPERIELRGVRHCYVREAEDGRFELGPVDLAIHRGETLFVVGGNGSGKTTLAMLLLGLQPPEAGELLLDGVAVTPDNVDAYRQHFSAVFADFHLFEELLLPTDEAVVARARRVVERLQMSHKVRVQPDGRFSTTKLSSGQRKRLALVSAWLEDRPVLLFDEWAADQDPAFKQVFYTELLPELKAQGKTVVVITHDDAYFDCADRLVKVEDGRVRVLEAPSRIAPHAAARAAGPDAVQGRAAAAHAAGASDPLGVLD